MNSLEQLWNETKQDAQPPSRVALNAPQTGVASPLEADGFPFAAHDMSFSPHLSASPEQRLRHERKIQELTTSWGASSPNTFDLNLLQKATHDLVEGAFAGDPQKVQQALKMGADSNTLVWVKDTQSPKTPPAYLIAPLGVAVAMLGQRQKIQNASDPQLKGDAPHFDEVARLLLTTSDNQSKVQVGVDKNNQSVLGYKVANIYVGDEAQYRHVPLSMAQQVAICRALPQALVDGRVAEQSDGVALGENLPSFLNATYADLYDPHQDSLTEAVKDFRARRLKSQDAPSVSPGSLKR